MGELGTDLADLHEGAALVVPGAVLAKLTRRLVADVGSDLVDALEQFLLKAVGLVRLGLLLLLGLLLGSFALASAAQSLALALFGHVVFLLLTRVGCFGFGFLFAVAVAVGGVGGGVAVARGFGLAFTFVCAVAFAGFGNVGFGGVAVGFGLRLLLGVLFGTSVGCAAHDLFVALGDSDFATAKLKFDLVLGHEAGELACYFLLAGGGGVGLHVLLPSVKFLDTP